MSAPESAAWPEILRGATARRQDLLAAMDAVSRAMDRARSAGAPLDLRLIPPDSHPLLLGAALRLLSAHSFVFQEKGLLLGWDEALAACVGACAREGIDARGLLMGML